jgi:hypothetical protein
VLERAHILGSGPTAHEILYSVRPKQGHRYPIWQRPFYVLACISNTHGPCTFRIELRLEELEQELVIQRTQYLTVDFGNDPLRVYPLSIMMKAAELPRPGVYRVCFVWNEQTLAGSTIHAR